jgi:chromosome partitioning protein
MKTIMVGKQKGGVGASTLARELGVAAASAKQRVVFVDLDPQGTLRGWWNRRTEGADGEPNPGLATPAPAQMEQALAQLQDAGADLCIIDTPPSIHAFLGSVMKLVDLILLPTRPTTDDLDALAPLLELVEDSGRPYVFVPTQVPAGRSRLYDQAVPVLAERGRVAPPLRLRSDFPVAAATGQTATEVRPGDKAALEVQALWQFVATDLAKAGRKRACIQVS